MIKSDIDMTKIKEAMSLFGKRANDLFKQFKEQPVEQLDHKEVVKYNQQSHRTFINKRCR